MYFRLAPMLAACLLFSAAGSAAGAAGAAAAAATDNGDGGNAARRERALLDRIDSLERRLTALESGRAGPDPAPPADSGPVTASGGSAATPAAEPAAEAAAAKPKPGEPFAFADFTWLTGNSRQKDSPLDSSAFTGEFRLDTRYTYSVSHPSDTIGGSSEIFRSGEFQLTQLGVGGDFHWKNARAAPDPVRDVFAGDAAQRREHRARGVESRQRLPVHLRGVRRVPHRQMAGINVDAGIFMSYVGLFSYYQYDNWSYQPSYVSSNTPWFFNGVRIQVFPSDRFKAELWIVNGWQSYGRFNHAPGLGFQLLWRPTSSLSILSNNYFGTDTPGTAARKRIHTDDSVQYKYLENPGRLLDSGPGGITPLGGNSGPPGSAVPGFLPDLRRTESRFTGALLVKL